MELYGVREEVTTVSTGHEEVGHFFAATIHVL